MTPEAQRIAIAKVCGWKAMRMSRRWEFSDDPVCPQDWCGRHPIADAWSHLPDYLNDLNAMHEAEKMLTPEQWGIYEDFLGHIEFVFHATAAQRAEAFLRTIGKWEDDK